MLSRQENNVKRFENRHWNQEFFIEYKVCSRNHKRTKERRDFQFPDCFKT